jgi:hypothetical protein
MPIEGRNESRTLKNGEIVALVRPPGEKWRISYYELQRVRYDAAAGGTVLEWSKEVPGRWKDRDFETADDAFAFIERVHVDSPPRSCQLSDEALPSG